MKVMKKPVTAEAVQLHETVIFPAMHADPGQWLVIEKGTARVIADHMFREEYNYRDPAVKMEQIDGVVCKNCGGKNLIRKGYRLGTNGINYLRRYCKDCRGEFSLPESPTVTTSTAILTGKEQVSNLLELAPAKTDTVKAISQKVSSMADNLNAGWWTPAELDIVGKEPDKYAATKAYRQSFPLSVRNDNGIQQRWLKMHPGSNSPGGQKRRGKLPKYITIPPKKEQAPDEITIIVPGTTPIVEKPLEECKAFFIGAQVKQVAGRTPHAMATGDIIEIKANGDIVVEFYHERKTCKRDELVFWKPDTTTTKPAVRS